MYPLSNQAAFTQRQSPRSTRTLDEGGNSDRWQQEEGLGSSMFAPLRFLAACQRSDPSARTQAWLLAPFIHHEVLKHYFVSCFVPATTRSPLAHKPPASMSWSARRLRQETFDERSTWKFSTWRVISALAAGLRTFFEIGEKCEKNLETASSAKREA